jgi:heme/copper-type cytochrome/quinol oxidase subunit 2
VQVVALPWKWLFIYPSLGIATVNYLEVPADMPLTFDITADAPMNSFWIPELGGQIYAMQGMVNPLHLVAPAGQYQGSSANYSGGGFADMRFEVESVPAKEFDQWALARKGRSTTLDWAQYQMLRAPGTTTPYAYDSTDPSLFDRIVGQFTSPGAMHHH